MNLNISAEDIKNGFRKRQVYTVHVLSVFEESTGTQVGRTVRLCESDINTIISKNEGTWEALGLRWCKATETRVRA